MIFGNKTYEGGLIDRLQVNSFQDLLKDIEIEINHQQSPSISNIFGTRIPIIPPMSVDINIKLTFTYSKYIELIISREISKYNSNFRYSKKDITTDLIVWEEEGKELFFHDVMLKVVQDEPDSGEIIAEFTAEHYEVRYNTKKEYEDVYE